MQEPSWRPPPGLELDLSPTNAVPPLPPVPPPPVAPPPAPAAPLAPLTGPALGSVGSAKHSTGDAGRILGCLGFPPMISVSDGIRMVSAKIMIYMGM